MRGDAEPGVSVARALVDGASARARSVPLVNRISSAVVPFCPARPTAPIVTPVIAVAAARIFQLGAAMMRQSFLGAVEAHDALPR
ncbi:MAG: hypothetical protein H0V93_12095 [Euzebyales bacterium]|nr:hypothetical protein [Euzebyales bacterium]